MVYLFVFPAKQKTPAAAEQFMVSPITGEKVSAEEMQKHMRYSRFTAG